MIRGIIFDMDGTLIDSIPIHYKAWADAFEKHGLTLTRELFDDFNGMQTPEIAEAAIKRFNLKADPGILAAEKRKLAAEELKKGVRLFDCAQQTLTILKRLGFYLGLATSSKKEHMEYAIGPYLGNIEFDSIITEEDVEKAKPEPEIFLKCCKKMELVPKECIVVEDAIAGIEAAKRAGMKVIAIANTTPKEKLKDADAIIERLDEINSVLIKRLGEEQDGRNKK